MTKNLRVELTREEYSSAIPLIFDENGHYNTGFYIGGAPGYTLHVSLSEEDFTAFISLTNLSEDRFY